MPQNYVTLHLIAGKRDPEAGLYNRLLTSAKLRNSRPQHNYEYLAKTK